MTTLHEKKIRFSTPKVLMSIAYKNVGMIFTEREICQCSFLNFVLLYPSRTLLQATSGLSRLYLSFVQTVN